MEFNELVADFAVRHKISNLSPEDNTIALEIDGITTTIVAEDDDLIFSAEIGEPPAEGEAIFANLLLETNLRSNAFFAKSPNGGPYILMRRIAMSSADIDAFEAALEALVNQAESWRRMLIDFRPVAEAAAEHSEEEKPSFGTSGFMHV